MVADAKKVAFRRGEIANGLLQNKTTHQLQTLQDRAHVNDSLRLPYKKTATFLWK